MLNIIKELDRIAGLVEGAGLIKDALCIDILSNTLEAIAKDDPIIRYFNIALKVPKNSLLALEAINNTNLLKSNTNFNIAYNILRGGCDNLPWAHKDAKIFIQEALNEYTNKVNPQKRPYTYFNS